MEKNDSLEPGGRIRLSGFSETDSATMMSVKKMVEGFVNKVSEREKGFLSLSLTLKRIHTNEKSSTTGKFELACNLVAARHCHAEAVHQNLLVALGSVLKKVESELE